MLSPIRILVLDDSPEDVQWVQMNLEKQGVSVELQRVGTQESFVEALQQSPDLLLLDYTLPQFDGVAALKIVRDHGLDTPCIFISGTFGEDVLAGVMNLGADDFLLKDRLARLGTSVRHALEQKQLRDERKRSESALREKEANLDTLIENVNGSLWSVDNHYCLLTGNQQFQRRVKEARGRELDQGESILFAGLPDDLRDLWRERYDQALGGESFRVEDATHFASEPRLFEHHLAPIRESSGAIVGVTVFGLDVTERKQSEEKLRQSEERFLKLFHLNPNPVTLTRFSDRKLVEVNAAFSRYTGYAREEALGRNADELNLWADAQVRAQYLALRQTQMQVKEFEWKYRTKAGELRDALMTTEMIEIQGEPFILSTNIDITERKRADEQIYYQASLLDNVNDAIIASDENSRITAWNTAAELMYGWKAIEVIGQSGAEIVKTEFEGMSRADVLNILSKHGKWRGEVTQTHKDGSRFFVETASIVLHDMHGGVTGYVSVNRDITERRKAEDSINQYLLRLERSENQVRLGNWEYVPAAGKGWWSKQMYRMLGFQVPWDESQNAPGFDEYLLHIHPDDRSNIQRELTHMAEGQEPKEWEYRTNPEFCPERILWPSYGVDRDGQGNISRFYGTLLDVTERKQAEEILQQTTETLNAIVMSVPVGIISFDLEGYIQTWNTAAGLIFGWEEKEVLGRLAPHIPPEMMPEFRRLQEQIHNGVTISNLELRRRKKDGTPITINLNAAALHDRDGKIVGHVAVIEDITERRQTADKLQESEATTRLIIDTALDAVITIDRDGRVIQWNDQAEGIFGWTRSEALGQKISELIIPADQSEVHEQGLRHYFETGEGPILNQRIEILARRKNGETFPVELAVHALSYNGKTTFAGFVRDITSRKHAQMELRRYAQNTTTIYQFSQQILTRLDLDFIYQSAHQAVRQLMPSEVFLIALLNESIPDIEDVYLWDQDQRWPAASQPVGQGLTSYVISTGKPLLVNLWDDSHAKMTGSTTFGYTDQDTQSVLAVPLFHTNGKCFGMISTQSYSPNAYTAEHEQLLVTLANQVSEAISKVRLFEELQHSNAELSAAYDATIEGWSMAMDLRDKETEGHTQRVTNLTIKLARHMGIPESEIVQIRRGALLHDIGKLGVPDHILLKKQDLTDEEWEIMRKHPLYAFEMLSSIIYLRSALDIPYCHHEKWDGAGYPRGLKGEEIPLHARIFAIVDVWDALTSDRSYRKAWTKEQTIEYIQDQSGKYFEPQIVEAFLQLITNL